MSSPFVRNEVTDDMISYEMVHGHSPKTEPEASSSSGDDDEEEEVVIDGMGEPVKRRQRPSTSVDGLMTDLPTSSPYVKDELGPGVLSQMTNMWSMMNIALPLSYFIIGFAMTFTSTPMTVYVVHTLNATPAQVNVLSTLSSLPWSFKLIYGLLSDCVPINGQRRKPYFIIGWCAYVAANFILAAMTTPGIRPVVFLSFASVAGFMLSDVMCDAIIVERSKFEPASRVGAMQAVGYMCRYSGNIVGSIIGTVIYNKEEFGWGLEIGQILMLNGLAAVVLIFPFMYFLVDAKDHEKPRPLSVQFQDLWAMVTLRSVYRPMTFIAVYNMLFIPNAAWKNFLIKGLHFNDWKLGVLGIIASIFSWMGITTYRYCLFKSSWRVVYIVTTGLIVVFSVMQLLLIFQINRQWGISDLAFALGDDAITHFVMAAQFLPAVKMFLRLCPDGAEGTAYAALTTFSNVAGSVGYNIGTLLTKVWDVSNNAIVSGDWSGLWKLSLLTSLLQPLGLVLIRLLPRDAEDQEKLQQSKHRSFWGGLCFAVFLVGALLWTLIQSIIILVQ